MSDTPENLPFVPRKKPIWFWPLVCLTLLSAAGFAASFCLTMSLRRRSEPVRMALALAQKDARVAALGSPLEAGFLILGDSKTLPDRERCYWKFAVTGPGGAATLRLDAVRPAAESKWSLDCAQIYLLNQDSGWITLAGDPDKLPEDFNAPKKEIPKETAK